jgi:hypothetical protein
VKVHEVHRTSAAHHPPRSDGRVDPARQQTHDTATHADGQTAGPPLLAEGVERVLRDELDPDVQFGVVEVYRPAERRLHASADQPLDVR